MAKKASLTKAEELMRANKSVEERSEVYTKAIKRNLQKNVLDKLTEDKEKLEDERFDLENFTLNTDMNAGVKQMTKEDCEKRFLRLIEIDFEIEMLDRELKIKQESFTKYFGVEEKSE